MHWLTCDCGNYAEVKAFRELPHLPECDAVARPALAPEEWELDEEV